MSTVIFLIKVDLREAVISGGTPCANIGTLPKMSVRVAHAFSKSESG